MENASAHSKFLQNRLINFLKPVVADYLSSDYLSLYKMGLCILPFLSLQYTFMRGIQSRSFQVRPLRIFRYRMVSGKAKTLWHILFCFKQMQTLFPIERAYPKGFEYIEDFLTEMEERELCSVISTITLHSFIFQGFEAKRKVASFGYDYSFDKRKLSKGEDIPVAFRPLTAKVASRLGLSPDLFAELLITEYPVGSVINWHRDAPPFDIIAGISLRSDCIFRLRPQDKEKQGRGSVISFPVRRRSLYIMQGAARSDWQHSTAPVKETRYSITLRTLKNG